ncbi:MAG: hypothetical protein HZR80_18800 [Candidatus Heimdallarchaeota archaeon]
MPFVQSFSTFVPGMYAIELDRDGSITNAVDTLKENVPNINIIEYGSAKHLFLSHRIIEPIVWIGHGDKEGISTTTGKLSWLSFSKELFISPSIDIVLSCHSGELVSQTPLTDEKVLTFNNDIDSIYGSLIVSYLLTGQQSIITEAANHYWSILKSETEYQPLIDLDPGGGDDGGDTGDDDSGGNDSTDPDISVLIQQIADMPDSYAQIKYLQDYVFYKMSGIELGFHLISLIILVIELVLACTLAPYQFTFIQAAAIDFMTVGIVSMLTGMAYYVDGQMTEAELVDEFLGSFSVIGECIWKAYKATTIWERITFIALLVAGGIILSLQLLGDALTAGAVTAIRITVSVILIGLYIYDFMYDFFDDDYVVG